MSASFAERIFRELIRRTVVAILLWLIEGKRQSGDCRRSSLKTTEVIPEQVDIKCSAGRYLSCGMDGHCRRPYNKIARSRS